MNNIASVSQQLASGALSAREALTQAVARIDATDSTVNAFTGKTLERAQQEAAAVDERRARGEVLGPLAGIPYAVKNLFDIAGEVTLAGSKLNRSHAPAEQDLSLIHI